MLTTLIVCSALIKSIVRLIRPICADRITVYRSTVIILNTQIDVDIKNWLALMGSIGLGPGKISTPRPIICADKHLLRLR